MSRDKPIKSRGGAIENPKRGNKPAAHEARVTGRAGAAKPLAVEVALVAPGAPDPATPMLPTLRAFLDEYMKDFNGTAAYRRVHPDAAVNTAATESWRILRKPEAREFIESERKKLTAQFGMTKEEIVAGLVAIVRADPTEMMQIRQVSCGSCWGSEKVGQWVEPDPECPECMGIGVTRTWFADTRQLSPAVRPLFAGVKVTKEGLQLLLESKDAAREKLAKILGAYEADNRQKADALGDLLAGIGRSALPVVKEPQP